MIDSFNLSPAFRVVDAVRSLYEEANAGGASAQFSEYLSGVVYYSLGSRDFIEEMAVDNWRKNWGMVYKQVDYLCTIFGNRIGVSVKRAVNRDIMFQLKSGIKSSRTIDCSSFDRAAADKFLTSAIKGLIVARQSVLEHYDFSKSVLHIWCPTKRVARVIHKAFKKINRRSLKELEGYLILHLTVCYDPSVYIGTK